jgi:peptidoglycan/LPS O-acetylase OafA/YrhL
MAYGVNAVPVFIVLSGYCLMLPAAKSEDGQLKGGIGRFVKRRAWRILPPYYAALILAWVLIYLSHRSKSSVGIHADNGIWREQFQSGMVLSHLALVHNFSQKWVMGIDMPMWSVAPEWQIYFIFALILLPVWRKWGAIPVLLLSSLSFVPHFVLPQSANWDWTCPWFVALFTWGMLAAVADYWKARPTSADPARLYSGMLALAAGLWVLCLVIDGMHIQLLAHSTFAITAIALIMYCGRNPHGAVSRVLSGRPFRALGAFSYSIYLTHEMIVPRLNVWAAIHCHSPLQLLILMFGPGLLVCLGFAYGFYWVFERSVMTIRKKI